MREAVISLLGRSDTVSVSSVLVRFSTTIESLLATVARVCNKTPVAKTESDWLDAISRVAVPATLVEHKPTCRCQSNSQHFLQLNSHLNPAEAGRDIRPAIGLAARLLLTIRSRSGSAHAVLHSCREEWLRPKQEATNPEVPGRKASSSFTSTPAGRRRLDFR